MKLIGYSRLATKSIIAFSYRASAITKRTPLVFCIPVSCFNKNPDLLHGDTSKKVTIFTFREFW